MVSCDWPRSLHCLRRALTRAGQITHAHIDPMAAITKKTPTRDDEDSGDTLLDINTVSVVNAGGSADSSAVALHASTPCHVATPRRRSFTVSRSVYPATYLGCLQQVEEE